MESLTVPVITLASGIIAWNIWITIRLFQNETRIAVNTSNDENVSKQIEDVKKDVEKRIDKFETHVNAKFDKVFDEIRQITRR